MPTKVLQHILKILSKLILWRYQPIVIGITGSVGKTSTKEAIYTVLESKFKVRETKGSYNNEIGVPLTILGEERTAGKNILKWLWIFLKAIILFVFKNKNFPEILVLEMGADRPGDIKYLIDFTSPRIGVVTAVGEIPVHVEFFSGPRAVAREKRTLVERIPIDGFSILNFDDDVVIEMKNKTSAHVLTFGFGENADIRASNYELRVRNGNPRGMSFKIDYSGSTVPVRANKVFGKQQVYALLAAFAVGVALKMNPVDISGSLEGYQPPPGRIKLLKGIKETWIIDDTYNASPLSTLAALEILRDLPGKRKIAVLGDMLEIGKYTVEAHETIGEEAAKVCDFIFAVGLRAKFIYDEAISRGFPTHKIFHFYESQEVGVPLQKILQPGDLILVKGSRAMKMEKVVLEVMAFPHRQRYLLVS